MPVPFQSARDLQSLRKLTKQNGHFDEKIINICLFLYREASQFFTLTQIYKINGF